MTAPATDANRLLLPFNLLALAVLVLMATLLANAVRQRQVVRERIEVTDMQGQQAVAARLHYFELFRDLVDLAEKDAEARAIVRRYNIEFTEPQSVPEVSLP